VFVEIGAEYAPIRPGGGGGADFGKALERLSRRQMFASFCRRHARRYDCGSTMRYVLLIGQLLILLVVANGTPIIVERILGTSLAFPIDGGRTLADGRPVFGSSKTVRGFILSILTTPLVAPLIGLDWKIGALVALMAMSGDLVSSFVKRRMGRPPSSRAIGLDQVPESLLPLLACTLFLPLGFLDVMVTVTLFFIGELALSRVLFKLHIRNRPY
jgi:CDP-2,3-bis-(O-geranylgeranyl)-sn-glycerol synthase